MRRAAGLRTVSQPGAGPCRPARRAAVDGRFRVSATNFRVPLLAASAGRRASMGLDPGYRTGVKVAVVDATGKVVATETVYPHVPHCRWDEALAVLSRLVRSTTSS